MANKISYRYTGITSQGKRTNGNIEANDVSDAHNELKKMGIEVINLEQKSRFSFHLNVFSKRKRVKPADILLFTRYLSTMIAAGLPIVRALDIISRDQDNPSMQTLVTSIRNNVVGGQTLAESFSQYPNYFSNLYCNLIRAGEKSGTLDKILKRLGNYLERSESLKRKIKKALVYPIAIISVAMIVSLILLIFVVPQFQTMFESFGARLPWFTQMIVNLSNFVRRFWWLLILIIVATVWGLKNAIRRSEAVKLFIDKWSLKLFVIGPVLTKGIIARFTRTLATTIEAGMPVVDSMKTMSAIVNNRVYAQAVDEICAAVASGNQLSVSMAETKLFPNMTIQMIAVGEASGSLAEMLNNIANYYEEDVNTVVDNLSSLLEPLIMLLLGVIVGTFVVAMYLPIFKIGSLF